MNSSSFGEFGDEKRQRGDSTFISLVKYVILGIVVVSLPAAFFGWRALYVNVLEKEKPVVELEKIPPGIGVDPVGFKLFISDKDAGLDEIVVRAIQGTEVDELVRISYEKKTEKDTVSFRVDGRELGLLEGEVQFSISVFDRSFWSNVERRSVTLTVDYKTPQVDLLTTQHNAVLGGVQMVFYRLVDNNGIEDCYSQVTVGSIPFPGFPAHELDKGFQSRPDIYFAFFAVPLTYDFARDSIELTVRDKVGNTATRAVPVNIRRVTHKERSVDLDQQFLDGPVKALYQNYLELSGQLPEPAPPSGEESEDNAARIERFRAVNEEYREALEESLRKIFDRPKARRLWESRFARLPLKRMSRAFGDTVRYRFKGAQVGSRILSGIDYRGKTGFPVNALNHGVVIFATDLGVYGNTVIIDHGFGLNTLYGHLSEIDCTEGDRIDKGDFIGKLGSTGLAPESMLAFEVRLRGVPVRPAEWWDKKWIDDHIEARVNQVKRLLGLPVMKRLDR